MTLATAARCLARDCGWSAEGGPETDRAAEKHTRPGHATATVTTVQKGNR